MKFPRQNPRFVAVLASAFLGGTVILVLWRGATAEAVRAAEAAERARAQLEVVLAGSAPAAENPGQRVSPTEEHRAFLEERVTRLRTTLEDLRGRLRVRDPSWLADPADELSFLPKVREFVRAQRTAAARAGTALAPDEAFGFAAFATAAETPPPDQLPLLDRQRQVLAYILAQLLAASPSRIVAVQREAVGAVAAGSGGPDADTFVRQAWPGRPEEEPGATLFFRVVFEGKTATLRTFLEELATFALPVVVRSVEVEPAAVAPRAGEGAGPDSGGRASGSSWDQLFGTAGPEASGDPAPSGPGAAVPPGPALLLADNESRFTVLLLWIEEGSFGTAKEDFGEEGPP